jgi:hypothetical protein
MLWVEDYQVLECWYPCDRQPAILLVLLLISVDFLRLTVWTFGPPGQLTIATLAANWTKSAAPTRDLYWLYLPRRNA